MHCVCVCVSVRRTVPLMRSRYNCLSVLGLNNGMKNDIICVWTHILLYLPATVPQFIVVRGAQSFMKTSTLSLYKLKLCLYRTAQLFVLSGFRVVPQDYFLWMDFIWR